MTQLRVLRWPDRGNWSQLAAFAVQYALMFLGVMSLMFGTFEWKWVFTGLFSGVLLGMMPRILRSNVKPTEPA